LNHKDSSWIGASAFSTIVFIIIISLGILFTSLIFIIRNMQLTVISADQSPEGLLYASSLSADLLPAVFIGLSMPENSRHDALFHDIQTRVARFNTTNGTSFTVQLSSLSDRLNVNSIDYRLLDSEAARQYLPSNFDPEFFRDYREETGFTTNIDLYEPIFRDAIESAMFTGYGYFNINVSYPESVGDLALYRTGDGNFAANVIDDINDKLRTGTLWEQSDVNQLFQSYVQDMHSLAGTRPMMNVNFISAEALHTVLFYEYGREAIEEFRTAENEILLLRERQVIDANLLSDILQMEKVKEDHPLAERILSHLGTISWFWKLKVENENGQGMEYIFFRHQIDDNNVKFQIIGQQTLVPLN
jgi:hypothetical protein